MDSKITTIRLEEDLEKILNSLCDYLHFSKTKFITIAIWDYISRLEKNDFNDSNFNFIEYALIKKSKTLREMQGLFRNEIKSKNFFLQRTYQDILELLLINTPLSEIKKLIKARRLEVKFYFLNNKEEIDLTIMEELERLENIKEEDYKSTIEMLRSKFYDDKQLSIATKKRKGNAIKLIKGGNNE